MFYFINGKPVNENQSINPRFLKKDTAKPATNKSGVIRYLTVKLSVKREI